MFADRRDSLARIFPRALRPLVKAPAFALLVVITLALAIGSNAAVFTLIDQLLLRTLPVEQPESLVALTERVPMFERTFEMRIRLALGATRRSIQRIVIREALLVTMAGAPFGLAAYLASSRVVGSFLYDLSPGDVPTMAAGASMLLLVTLVAGFVPARKATTLDPAVTLRRE